MVPISQKEKTVLNRLSDFSVVGQLVSGSAETWVFLMHLNASHPGLRALWGRSISDLLLEPQCLVSALRSAW